MIVKYQKIPTDKLCPNSLYLEKSLSVYPFQLMLAYVTIVLEKIGILFFFGLHSAAKGYYWVLKSSPHHNPIQ